MDTKVKLQDKIDKCVVIEVNEDHIICLKDDGDILSLKKKSNIKVGTKIYYSEDDLMDSKIASVTQKIVNFRKKTIIGLMATAACLLLLLSNMANVPVTAYAQISVDINPSIELKLDKTGRVIDVFADNSDGEVLLDADDLSSLRYDVAVNHVIETAKKLGYMKADSPVLFGVASLNNSGESLADEITKSLSNMKRDFKIKVIEGDYSIVEKAGHDNISIGRYMIMDANKRLNIDDAKKSSVESLLEEDDDEDEDEDDGDVDEDEDDGDDDSNDDSESSDKKINPSIKNVKIQEKVTEDDEDDESEDEDEDDTEDGVDNDIDNPDEDNDD